MEFKDFRLLSRKTQLEIGQKTGIHNSRICLIEKGYVKARPHERRLLARALGVDPSIIDWHDED